MSQPIPAELESKSYLRNNSGFLCTEYSLIWPPCLGGICSRVGLELLSQHGNCCNEPFSFPCSKLGCFEVGIANPLQLQVGDELFPAAATLFNIGNNNTRLLRVRGKAWTLNVWKLFSQEGGWCSTLHHVSPEEKVGKNGR